MEAKTFNILTVAGIVIAVLFMLNNRSGSFALGETTQSGGFPGWNAFMSLLPKFSGNWSSTSHYLQYNTPDPSAFWPSPLPELTNNALGYSAYDSYFNTQAQNPRF